MSYEIDVKAVGIKGTPIVKLEYDTRGVMFLVRAVYEKDLFKPISEVDFKLHPVHEMGSAYGNLKNFEELIPQFEALNDKALTKVVLTSMSGDKADYEIPVIHDEEGTALLSIDSIVQIEDYLKTMKEAREPEPEPDLTDLLMESIMDGVITCPKCGNQIEPDCERCSCGWYNEACI